MRVRRIIYSKHNDINVIDDCVVSRSFLTLPTRVQVYKQLIYRRETALCQVV